ncbi:MAG: queuosine precursor transporter, partial [Bryobacteraceae bacterium]
DQEVFARFLGRVPRVVAASLAAYWAGEFANSFVLSRMKVLTKGRHLWTRTIASTAVGQAVDTVVVVVLIFAGHESWATIGDLIFYGYTFKVLYEAAATPVTYAVVNFLKRKEGIDVFDEGVDFSPFRADV